MGAVVDFFGNLKVLISAITTKPPSHNAPGSVATLVEQHARQRPDDIALLCEDEMVTWSALNTRANRVAASLDSRGIKQGDCVALFMQNRVEFVVNMLALNKLGAIAGMINTNLIRQPLIHCINLVESKACIFGEELTEPLNEIRQELNLADGQDFYYVKDSAGTPPPNWAVTLDSTDDTQSDSNPPQSSQVLMGDTAFYIFTSGTTGLPKAAVITGAHALSPAAMSADYLMRLKRNDRVYNCLPLYHGTGLLVGLLAAIHVGASTVLKRRLSVSVFWDDIRKNNCTAFVYIGEFIRYLMNQAPQANDADNPIRTIVGNGLRPDIWMQFKKRFGIERIGEFYGASEGNGGFANVFNKDCTVGLGTAAVMLAEYDVAQDEIVRGQDGLCRAVAKGEPGLLLIKVSDKSKFEGYTDPQATEKKLVKNVQKQGDVFFNSGDLMRTVDVGFAFGQKHYQFVDRIGDTFRWKSENVSTNEVAEIINSSTDIVFTNVYGVEIPGTDGRAGMAAIVFRDGVDLGSVDLSALSAHINDHLPAYARPVFIRVLKELPTTSTLKMQKNDLREQAYHLDRVQDALLVMKPRETVYCRLDTDYYDKIMQREAGF